MKADLTFIYTKWKGGGIMKFFQVLKSAKGFTLVELLIVIAVIGVLAVAVLSALNPVEQMRKSRDTGKLADARELLSAYQRYYASNNCFPSDNTATGCDGSTNVFGAMSTLVAPVNTDLQALETEQEVKTQFRQKASIRLGHLFVGISATDTVAVCFNAESRAARTQGFGDVYSMVAGVGPGAGVITATNPPTCATPFSATNINQGCLVCVQ